MSSGWQQDCSADCYQLMSLSVVQWHCTSPRSIIVVIAITVVFITHYHHWSHHHYHCYHFHLIIIGDIYFVFLSINQTSIDSEYLGVLFGRCGSEFEYDLLHIRGCAFSCNELELVITIMLSCYQVIAWQLTKAGFVVQLHILHWLPILPSLIRLLSDTYPTICK